MILIPLAEGFEEIEASVTIDILRRAGLDVVIAGIPGTIVKGVHEIKMIADKKMEDINLGDVEALVLVGGNPGYINLSNSKTILDLVKKLDEDKKLVAAICGGPLVLARAGILADKVATVYPGLEREIPKPRNGMVLVDQNVITAVGPGATMEFALKIVETLKGPEEASKLRGELLC